MSFRSKSRRARFGNRRDSLNVRAPALVMRLAVRFSRVRWESVSESASARAPISPTPGALDTHARPLPHRCTEIDLSLTILENGGSEQSGVYSDALGIRLLRAENGMMRRRWARSERRPHGLCRDGREDLSHRLSEDSLRDARESVKVPFRIPSARSEQRSTISEQTPGGRS